MLLLFDDVDLLLESSVVDVLTPPVRDGIKSERIAGTDISTIN